MKIHILGNEWEIIESTEEEDELLKGCDGYTDWTRRLIVNEKNMPGSLGKMDAYIRKVKRHEIIHAFLLECGLDECSGPVDAWAQNETMVDWIARLGPKILIAWSEAQALSKEDS